MASPQVISHPMLRLKSQKPRTEKAKTKNEKLKTDNCSLLQRFEHLALDLSVRLDAPGHAHRARLKHQAAVAVVRVGEKHHFIHAALVLQRDEHHVAVIFCSH